MTTVSVKAIWSKKFDWVLQASSCNLAVIDTDVRISEIQGRSGQTTPVERVPFINPRSAERAVPPIIRQLQIDGYTVLRRVDTDEWHEDKTAYLREVEYVQENRDTQSFIRWYENYIRPFKVVRNADILHGRIALRNYLRSDSFAKSTKYNKVEDLVDFSDGLYSTAWHSKMRFGDLVRFVEEAYPPYGVY